MIENNQQQKVYRIEKVGDEIEAGNDELATWADQRGSDFFLKPDSAMISALQSVSAWTMGQGYDPAAVNTFFQVADYYLVAFAVARTYTVVTHERADPSIKKVKIPNVCIGFNVKCVTPYEMLRRERARFVLGPS